MQTAIAALALTTLFETVGIGHRPVSCSFPAGQGHAQPIEMVLTARPSLKDMPGLYRVDMQLNEALTLKASVQPILATKARDVVIRARSGETIFVVGIDQAGAAALNVMEEVQGEAPREVLRPGQCRNHERYIRAWAPW